MATLNPLGYRTTTLFDSYNRVRGTQDAAGFSTDTVFDRIDRPVADIDPLGYRTTTLYRADGAVEAVTDALGRQSTTLYDSVGRIQAQVSPLGYRTTYSYSPRGETLAVTNARGYLQSALYDALGRAFVAIDQLGRRTTVAFDAGGNPIHQVDAKGQVETRVYDAMNRETSLQYADGTRVTTTYDNLGRVLVQANQHGRWSRTYDGVGRVRTENAPNHPLGRPLTSLYDLAGNRTALQTWRGNQTYTYNGRNELHTLREIEGGLYTHTYEGRGLITRVDFPNRARMTATYDALGRTLQIMHGGAYVIANIFNSYDPAGNLASRRRRVSSTRESWATYAYDASNQLLTEDHSAVGRPPRGLTTWVYDPVGNRLSATSTAPGPSMLYATYTYATDDALLTEARTQSGAGSSLSTFSYDANGNRTLEEKGAQRFTYTWDPANRLTKITQAPGTGGDLTNQYRPDGLRAAGGNAMVWDGSDLLSEIRTSDGQIAPYYTRGNTLLKTRNDVTGNTEWFHLDEQGTRVQTSQTSGLPYPGMSDLGPWGEEPIVVTGAPTGAASWIADPGYYLEPKLARMLYYVRARWYPAGGPGWLSKDPVGIEGGDVNLFRYVLNQPVRLEDSLGLQSELLDMGLTGGGGPGPHPCLIRTKEYCDNAQRTKSRGERCICRVSNLICKVWIMNSSIAQGVRARMDCLNRCMFNRWKNKDTPLWKSAERTCEQCGQTTQMCCTATLKAEQNGLTLCDTYCRSLGPLPGNPIFPLRTRNGGLVNEITRRHAAWSLCCKRGFGGPLPPGYPPGIR